MSVWQYPLGARPCNEPSREAPVTADKVLILGLDGATLDVVAPWARAGALPAFADLLDKGASGPLRSTLPPVTPQAWPSVYTGTNAGKHGIFGFEKRLPGSYGWAKSSAADLARPPLWELAAREGVRSGLFFLPYVYPTTEMNGWVVAGRGAPGGLRPHLSWPRELAGELAGRFGEAALFGERRPVGWSIRQIAEALVDSVRQQTDAMVWAIKKGSFDLVFGVWDQPDTAAHLLWHFSEQPCPPPDSPLAAVYRAVDDGIARLRDAMGGDPLVIVCSDHGAYPIRWKLRVPSWLAQQGMLSSSTSFGARAVAVATRAWNSTPAIVRRHIPSKARDMAHAAHKQTITQNTSVDWPRTRVYPEPISAEAFRLNLQGREPDGCVPVAAAPETIAELTRMLRELEAPDGSALVEGVVDNAAAYNGPLADRGPDLIAELSYGTYFSPTASRPLISAPARPSLDDPPASLGYHHPDGLVIVAGPGVAPGNISASVTDLAPTVLRNLGVAIPVDLDGTAIEEAFVALPEVAWTEAEPDLWRPEGTGLTEGEEQEIAQRLRDLGYLD